MTYYLAPSLKALGNEVTASWSEAWPTVRLGDGWVGDTSHQARKSDHNPDWDAGGVVRAVDIGIEGRDAARLLTAVIGDERVWYVIHKGVIYSRTYGWEPRAYTGSNPHNHHIHISIRHDRDAENDTAPWLTKPDQEGDDLMATKAEREQLIEELLNTPLNFNDPKGEAEFRGVTIREALKAVARGKVPDVSRKTEA